MINIKEIIEVLEETNITTKFYYNKITNKILLSEYIEKFGENIIPMFDIGDKDDFAFIKSYIDTLNNKDLQNKLYSKTNILNEEAIHNFLVILKENNLLKDWYRYRANIIKQMAIDWCNKNNIAFEDK